jgi:hypothetical protein
MIDATFPEALCAMTGLTPTRAPSYLEIRGAQSYAARIKRRLASFLEADKPAPMKWKKPPSQESLYESLTTPLDAAEVSGWLAETAFEAMVGYPMVIQTARDYVLARWPIYPDTSMGLHTFELAPDEYGDVWHLFSTLNDPETIFDDLDSLLLLPSQVEAFAAVYPELFATTKDLAALLLRPYVGIEGMIEQKKTLPWDREEQIRTLLQLPLDAPIEVSDKEQSENASGGGKPSQQKSTQTPSEHMAEKRLSK